MSNFRAKTKSPKTGKWAMADWIDDHFGNHIYGVQFIGEERIYNADEWELKWKVDKPKKKTNKEDFDGLLTWEQYKELEKLAKQALKVLGITSKKK